MVKVSEDVTMQVPCILKVGNYIYNGTSWEIINGLNNDKPFYIDIPLKKDEDAFGAYKSVPNTNSFLLGIGDLSGYIVNPLPVMTSGICEFTICQPKGSKTIDHGNLWNERYHYIKGIELAYAVSNTDNIYNDWAENKKKNDVVYENVISDTYVEEADEIELKICSYPDNYKKLCYSSTYIGSDYLKTLKYTPLAISDLPEKILINKVIEYYKTPKYQVSIPINNKLVYPYTLITDSNLSGKTFLYAGNEIDYEYEKNTINLIEI